MDLNAQCQFLSKHTFFKDITLKVKCQEYADDNATYCTKDIMDMQDGLSPL